MKLISAAVLGLFSGYASASGFQLIEQNASGLGNAHAGSAAVAENASTIFFNPAGMTQLQAREASVGINAIKTSFKFSDQGSSVGGLANAGNGGDGGGWGFVPNGYFSMALSKDLYFGVGFGAPFGLKTQYDNPWKGAAQSVMFDVKTYNINPSIAYRVNDKVSIGGGLNWQRLEAEYQRQVGVAAAPLPTSTSSLTLNLDGDAWGWNVGALFTLSPATKVGVSYRSEVKYNLDGKIQVSSSSATVVNAGSSNAKADLTLPATAVMSVTQDVSDRWQMLGDVSWTGWSSIPKIDVVRTSQTALYVPGVAGQTVGQVAQTLDTEFRDTWRVALGANYKLSDTLKLKFGIAYDQTPVKGASTRLVSLPDNDRTWFSFGTQWVPSKGNVLDFGVAYLYVKDAKIDNNQGGALNRGRVTGNYEDSAWILGAQYSVAF